MFTSQMMLLMAVILISTVLLFLSISSGFKIQNVFKDDETMKMPPPWFNQESESIGISLEKLMQGPVSLPDDHPYLIQHIRKALVPPSAAKGYKLRHPEVSNPAHGCQMEGIRNILGEMKDGFFIEAGAMDGEFYSNTFVFEREYGWSGLLVEADPNNFQELQKTQRKAWTINKCISTKTHPFMATFLQHPNANKKEVAAGQSKLVDRDTNTSERHFQIQCVPLYSILMALNITTVDYLSLDIQFVELDVLKTIPWDKLNIRTLTVEFAGSPLQYKLDLQQFMESVGYLTYTETGHRGQDGKPHLEDFIFHKKDIIPVVKAPTEPMIC